MMKFYASPKQSEKLERMRSFGQSYWLEWSNDRTKSEIKISTVSVQAFLMKKCVKYALHLLTSMIKWNKISIHNSDVLIAAIAQKDV